MIQFFIAYAKCNLDVSEIKDIVGRREGHTQPV